MRIRHIRTDLAVIGGGLAGVTAAIAAAREGLTVALVQDRPVLGGNSSSEVRLWALGAGHARLYTRYAREGGIMGELFLENLYRNPEGNAVLWDPLLYEWVTREKNITLILDTAAYRLEQAEDGTILNVSAFSSQNETEYVIHAPLFVDSSGDGIVGFLSGAEYRVGREPKSEFGEAMAPDVPDRNTLGHSLYFHIKDAGKPVKFVKPAFAIDVEKPVSIKHRPLDRVASGSHLWWIEYGGLLDTIHDTHEIKAHLWAISYGIWDYVKNSGEIEGVENLTLEWVGMIPGKRESRRFMGDYILTEGDCLVQQSFPDSVLAGGWSLDLHPSAGIYSPEPPCDQVFMEGVYDIPYRTLYSHNVPNLFVAGRIMSASHVAFGSTRVMATCAAMGQAVGTAAMLCMRDHVPPRECASGDRLEELRRRLLRNDQHIPNAVNDDPADLARQATVTASSSALLEGTRKRGAGKVKLDQVRAIMAPVVSGRLDEIALLVDVDAATELRWSLQVNDRLINYIPKIEIASGSVAVAPGERQWVAVPTAADTETAQNVWLVLEPNEAVTLHTTTDAPIGVATMCTGMHRDQKHWPWEEWNAVFRMSPAQPCWGVANVIDGHARPRILPHIWVSEPIVGNDTPWVSLKWDSPRRPVEIQIALNSDLDKRLYTVQKEYENRVILELVRDLHVEALSPDGRWCTVAAVKDNHHRVARLPLPEVETTELRVVVDATNGHDRAEIYEIRVY